MELKDFIQTAVTQIVEGVVAAQAAAAAHHVVVNPAVRVATVIVHVAAGTLFAASYVTHLVIGRRLQGSPAR